MESGDRILVAAGLTAAVVVGAFVLWGPGGAPRVRRRRGQISGLQNLGRTCFLNTLLQAMAACPTFIAWLKKHSAPTAHNSMITTLYTVIEVVNGTHESARGTAVCPLGVLQSLRAAGWVVPPEQQDAHELLHVLLACLEEETRAMAKKPGCLSDALGGFPAPWSALASPAEPAAPRPPRADSTPPTPTYGGRGRPRPTPTSAEADAMAYAAEPDLVEPEPPESLPPAPFGSGGLSKGLSRSFSHLSGSRRWLPPSTPRQPLPLPFRGSLASRLVCTVCNTKSPIRYDKFDSLSLPLPAAGSPLTAVTGCSLQGLLRAFTAPELVKGVRCGKCAPAKVPAAKDPAAKDPVPKSEETAPLTHHIRTVNIGKLPQCLCLHIGRVVWSAGGLSKRTEHVAFPDLLSLAPYLGQATQAESGFLSALGGSRFSSLPPCEVLNGANAGSNESSGAMYRLQAVVVHVGGPRSGHFATYRRGNGFEANRWWYTSDTLVHEVSLAEVLRCTAYMLFYERSTPGHSRALPPIDTSGNGTEH